MGGTVANCTHEAVYLELFDNNISENIFSLINTVHDHDDYIFAN